MGVKSPTNGLPTGSGPRKATQVIGRDGVRRAPNGSGRVHKAVGVTQQGREGPPDVCNC